MMLALGMFVFMRQTLPHQTMQRESDYRWPSNSRIGKQAESLIGKAGSVATRFTGMTGAG